MNKGEFIMFCKEFKILIPQTRIIEVFKKHSFSHAPLTLEQFADTLADLGTEVSLAQQREIKCRLREIKQVLEYPDNKIPVPPSIKKILENTDPEMENAKAGGYVGRVRR